LDFGVLVVESTAEKGTIFCLFAALMMELELEDAGGGVTELGSNENELVYCG